jgi:hypothetical protein
MKRFLLPLCAALLMTAASAQTQAQCPPRGGFMSQEARLMQYADMEKATMGKPADAIREYRQAQREKFMAMSEADRKKATADLTKRWAALPPAEQSRIKDAFDLMRQNHPMGGHGDHAGGPGGHGGPHGCPPAPAAH